MSVQVFVEVLFSKYVKAILECVDIFLLFSISSKEGLQAKEQKWYKETLTRMNRKAPAILLVH